jgi:very-short-patch-repair endonuclease
MLMPRIRTLNKYLERRRQLRHSSTPAELDLWDQLKSRQFRGLKFRRQYSVGNFILDFYCPKLRLAIEVDGDSHFDPRQAAYDHYRTEWLGSMYIRVIRFRNDEVHGDMVGVLRRLELFITSPTPPEFRRGRTEKQSNMR